MEVSGSSNSYLTIRTLRVAQKNEIKAQTPEQKTNRKLKKETQLSTKIRDMVYSIATMRRNVKTKNKEYETFEKPSPGDPQLAILQTEISDLKEVFII